MPPKYYRQISWVATFTERYVISILYLGFAWAEFQSAHLELRAIPGGDQYDYGYFVQHALMVVLDVSIGFALLFGRRASSAPKNMKEIAVPLAATFFYLFYYYVDFPPVWLPGWFVTNLIPLGWQNTFAAVGLIVGLFGRAISAWGAISLGRSFGIFVTVREIVLHGPYRYVRHPIYFGYFFFFGGLAINHLYPAYLILIPIHFALFAWRARLEETRLAESSIAYREYMKHSGFLFPKFRTH